MAVCLHPLNGSRFQDFFRELRIQHIRMSRIEHDDPRNRLNYSPSIVYLFAYQLLPRGIKSYMDGDKKLVCCRAWSRLHFPHDCIDCASGLIRVRVVWSHRICSIKCTQVLDKAKIQAFFVWTGICHLKDCTVWLMHHRWTNIGPISLIQTPFHFVQVCQKLVLWVSATERLSNNRINSSTILADMSNQYTKTWTDGHLAFNVHRSLSLRPTLATCNRPRLIKVRSWLLY